MKKHRDRRLFWEDDVRRHDPGTRSIVYTRHVVLMALMHKKEPSTQAFSGVLFDIDQSTFYRYMKLANEVFSDILPTARNISEIIKIIYNEMQDEKSTEVAPEKKAEVEVPQNIVGSPANTAAALPALGGDKRRPGLIESALKVSTSVISATITGMPCGGNGCPTTLV